MDVRAIYEQARKIDMTDMDRRNATEEAEGFRG
jgi:hypothetical protein